MSMKLRKKWDDSLLVVKTIRLTLDDYWSWFKYFLFGTLIIPVFYILLIESAAEITQDIFDIKLSFLNHYNTFSFTSFRTFELIYLLVIVLSFWKRCHIKAYSLNFTRDTEDHIQYIQETGEAVCSRCGRICDGRSFTRKETFQTGEKIRYYKEYYGKNVDDYHRVKEYEPIYEDFDVEVHERRCTNRYCGFCASTTASFSRMSLMPYKIADTVSYAIKTDSNERLNAGNLTSYKYGISLFWYTLLTVLLCFAGIRFDLNCFKVRYLDYVLVPLWAVFMRHLTVMLGVAVAIQFPLLISVKLFFYRKKKKRKKNKKKTTS